MLRFARHFLLGYVAALLALYRIHSANGSKQTRTMHEAELYLLEKALDNDPALKDIIGRRLVRDRLFELCSSIAYPCYDDLDLRAARSSFAHALGYRLADVRTWTLYLVSLLPESLVRGLEPRNGRWPRHFGVAVRRAAKKRATCILV